MTADLEDLYYQIYRYCYFRLHDRHTAEDVTQEAFLRYFEQERSQAVERIMPWLYTVARNLCADEFRRQTPLPLEESEGGAAAGRSPFAESVLSADILPGTPAAKPLSTGPSEPETAIVARLDLQDALAKLPQEDQELLLLRYVNEVPIHIICRMTGLSRFTVYRRIRRALKQLQLLLGKEHPN